MTVAADDIKNDNTSTTPTVDDSIENNGPSKKKKSFEITFKKDWKDKSHEQIREEVRKQINEQGAGNVSDKIISDIVDNIVKTVVKKEKNQSILLVWASVLATMLMGVLAGALILVDTTGKFVGKQDLQLSIRNSIIHGASLETLKTVFTNQSQNAESSFWPAFKPHLYYEKSTTTLADVLDDLKVGIYIRSASPVNNETIFLKKLEDLIFEYNKINPFDGLDEQDTRSFKNIAQKLNSSEYESAQDEISTIISSLKTKNSLIHQYLNSSNASLYISIAAFAFTLIFSLWQLVNSRRSSQKQLINEAIKEHFDNNQ
ncbi:hypothetical protein MXF29_06215 [Pseudomonas sp. NC26]|uniref:hypothetical protein n=1 Tax=unclassified Pseudomonas TaxID=196821 RepID=UPI002DE8B331|nr:hypothetical protein [Pseudomonas sp. NC26]